jgi:hypothetical protein
MADLKKSVSDFLNYDVDNIHDEESKEQLVDMFKDVISNDDETVLQFLKKFFENGKELAKEFDLIVDIEEPFEDEENTEEISDEENTETSSEENTEEPSDDENTEETSDEENVEEGTIFDEYNKLSKADISNVNMANRFLSDI